MPDNRLTVRAGPLGQLADRRPGPQDGLEQPRPVKTVYGAAKNTWASRQLHLGTSREHLVGRLAAAIYSLGVAYVAGSRNRGWRMSR